MGVFMSFFTRQGRTLLLMTAVAAVGTVCLVGCGGDGDDGGTDPVRPPQTQTDSASVLFVVNVDATVRAEPKIDAPAGTAPMQILVTAGEEAALRLPILQTVAPRLAKTTAVLDWTIIVSAAAAGYKDTAYTLKLTAGTNARQNITLREAAAGTYSVRISSVGWGASGSNNYAPGAKVNITAGTAPADYRFKNWTTESGGVTFAKADSAATSFTMPANTVTVTANFVPTNRFIVTVSSVGTGASGGGDYYPGDTVKIKAGTNPNGLTFRKWSASNGIIFADAGSNNTTFIIPSTSIMPSTSITVTAMFGSKMTDSRDGKTYWKVTIGGKNWMAENLNYAEGGVCYGEDTLSDAEVQANCVKYGRLYNWYTAKEVCPTGWHLPSNQEWADLVTAVGSYASTKLKSTSDWNWNGVDVNGTDDFEFSALPGGYRDNFNYNKNGTFFYQGIGGIGYWWTATGGSRPSIDMTSYISYAYYRSISDDVRAYEQYCNSYGCDMANGYSVRCLEDDD